MKRLALLIALSLCALPASAQTVRPAPSWLHYYLPIHPQVALVGGGGGATFSGGAITGATSFLDGINFSIKNTADPTKIVQFDTTQMTTGNTETGICFAGTATTPEVRFGQNCTSTNVGFKHDGSNAFMNAGTGQIVLQSGATNIALFSATAGTGLRLQGVDFQLCDGSAANCTQLNREAAGTLQLGQDVNGSAIAQTLKAQDGITGTDVVGSNLTVSSGRGTGAASGAQTSVARALMGATGTSAQTRVDGLTVCESKTLSNTTATAGTLVNIASASNSAGGAEWTTTVVATDGTNFDVEQQTCNIGWVNKAGTFTVSGAGTPVCTATVAASNSGSTTVGSTVTAATSVVSIKATPVFTTIVPTTVTAYTTIRNNSPGAVSCQ